ncbi:MAG: proline dehydrogenase family protein [Ignavibacteria bacterium]|nr:proline dehydrogenase family protein [Ignavibacteria bacterium]
MSILNKMVVGTLPYVPRRIVKFFAKTYIAGDSVKDAVFVSQKLNDTGIMGTIDVLGEDVFNKDDAARATVECFEVLDMIVKNKLSSNQSIKLTSLGLKIDRELCLSNVNEIFAKAKENNIFIRIDMEDSSVTEDTIWVFEEARKTYSNCGIVLQAYLKRTYDDALRLIESGTNFRLCKGIYIEPEDIAYKNRNEIRDNFLKILRLMLVKNSYVGIATHDDYLVEGAYKLIKELNKSIESYEFQMLLGVREGLRDKIVNDGHRMRIYIPFGTHWYQYSIRRFQENPQMAGYIVKSIFTGGR